MSCHVVAKQWNSVYLIIRLVASEMCIAQSQSSKAHVDGFIRKKSGNEITAQLLDYSNMDFTTYVIVFLHHL